MKNNALLAAAIVATALIAGCNSGGSDGARTTSQIAADEIAGNTSEAAAAIMLNDLPISDADTDESAKPVPVL